MWIEIFKGGPQTDSAGVTHDGDALIDAAVKRFDAAAKPPVVLGHPATDSPAYGWVEALAAKAAGGVKSLWADISPVEALKDWVNAGLYRNRSAAFYSDGRLRHVGFLGGAPPAVRGLAPLPAFADEGGVIEFVDGFDRSDRSDRSDGSNRDKGGFAMNFSEFMNAINIFKKMGGKDEDIDLIAPAIAPATPPAQGKTFTEADVEAARQDAAKEAREAAEAKFAEAETARKKEARAAEIKAFCEAGVEKGTIAPAWVAAGIVAFMERLDAGEVLAFAEGAEKKTPDAWFREFLSTLPKLIEFKEIATRAKDPGAVGAGARLEALTREAMKQDKTLTWSAAFSEVQREHPDLAQAYAAEL